MDTTFIQRHIANMTTTGSYCGQTKTYSGSDNPTPQPTVPTPTPDGNYIYFKNNDNWSQVNIYYWSDADTNMTAWPGKAMESIGNNEYRAEVPAGVTMVIFNNNNQGQQTGDLDLQGLGKIYDNGNWSTYNG